MKCGAQPRYPTGGCN